ncbi:MAG: glycosyltransferase family 2 protein [Acetobacteraceae bacterium]|nr:glycosyltransferase family 2 protein [Acetobacteraceae bacterium]
MTHGFLHYLLSVLDPMVNLGFSQAISELMVSELPWWWFIIVIPFFLTMVPSLVVWAVYLVRPTWIRPALPTQLQAEPLVSIVIAGRNESATIGECIRGALLCGYKNLEVIFVDDNSEDQSLAIARRATLTATGNRRDSERVRIFPSPRRNGKASSLNIGIRMARGEFIAITDADSVVQYGAIQHWLLPFRDPRVGAVAANIRVNNSTASLLTRFQEIEYALKVPNKSALAYLNLLYIISGMGGMFRGEILRKLGGFDTGLGDDRDLTMMIRKQRWRLAFSWDAVVWTTCPVTRSHLQKQRARWRRNVVKICVSKHRDQFALGRYGLSNTWLALQIVFGRMVFPIAVVIGMIWTTATAGPLQSPQILVTVYWVVLLCLLIRVLLTRDMAGTPMPLNFLLVPLYPFYLLFLVGSAQWYAEMTELFRIGAKHHYVPDHIWEEIPWW